MEWQLVLMAMFGLGVCCASAAVAATPATARRNRSTKLDSGTSGGADPYLASTGMGGR